MTEVLYLGPESHDAFVRACLPGVIVRVARSEAEAEAALPTCEVVLDAYMKVPFPSSRLALATGLRAVITATTGASHIDTEYLAARGVPLLTLKGQEHVTRNLTAAAEHSWLLAMAVARQLPAALSETRSGGWDRNKFPGLMFRGRVLGVVGCGRIGGWMARYAKAFGMRVLGFDAVSAPDSDLFEAVDLDTLLSSSDIVSIHVPLTDQTRHLLDRQKLAALKPGAILINTSRGEVLDESALLEGLRSGRIGGAGLDVMQSEPYVQDDPLIVYARDHNNLIITPHIGGFSPDALNVVLQFSCERVLAVLR